MKKLFFLLLFCGFTGFAQNATVGTIAPYPALFPVFPGCEESSQNQMMRCFQEKLKQHIRDNYNYPTEAQKNGLKGSAIVTYSIEADGFVKITKVEGEHQILNEEAKRIIQLLPKMDPAYQNGKPIAFPMTVPIKF